MSKKIIWTLIVLVILGVIAFVYLGQAKFWPENLTFQKVESNTEVTTDISPNSLNSETTIEKKAVSETKSEPLIKTENKNSAVSKNNCNIIESSTQNKSNPIKVTSDTSFQNNRVTISFKEGSDVRIREGKFVSLCGADLTSVNNYVFVQNNFTAERVDNTLSEEQVKVMWEKGKKSNPDMADFNLQYNIFLNDEKEVPELNTILDTLNNFEIIQNAQPVPRATTASTE